MPQKEDFAWIRSLDTQNNPSKISKSNLFKSVVSNKNGSSDFNLAINPGIYQVGVESSDNIPGFPKGLPTYGNLLVVVGGLYITQIYFPFNDSGRSGNIAIRTGALTNIETKKWIKYTGSIIIE